MTSPHWRIHLQRCPSRLVVESSSAVGDKPLDCSARYTSTSYSSLTSINAFLDKPKFRYQDKLSPVFSEIRTLLTHSTLPQRNSLRCRPEKDLLLYVLPERPLFPSLGRPKPALTIEGFAFQRCNQPSQIHSHPQH